MKEPTQSAPPDIQLFRDVFNASPIGIVVENLEGQPLFVNPAFCSMLGFSEEELHSKHCVDFSPPEDAEKDWALFRQLRAGSIDHYQLEKRYFRRDDSLVWGSLSISLLKSPPASLVLAMVQDITEKKTAEEARFRHAAIVESSEDAIASGTLDGIIVSWNAGAQNMYGYTEAEAVGKPITILVPPELPDEENKILETLKLGGRIEQRETIRVTKTGKRINVSLSVSPIKDSSGAIVGVAGIARDISDRKRHEEKLREYARAVENAGEMIAVVDREYRYLIANRQFLKLRNMTQEQVVGRFAYEVLTEGVFEAVVKPKLDECFQGKVVRYEMKYTYPELGERDLLVSYFPIEGAHGTDRAACIFQDITDRKRAEEALRASEERLRLAQQAANIGAFEWNIQTGVNTWTPELESMYGLPPGGFGGTQTAWENLVHRDDLAEILQRVNEALKTGRPMTGEWRVVWPDGSVHWIAGRWQVLMDEYGKPWRVLGVNIDVTERRSTEDALVELNRTLGAQSALLQSSEELLKIFVKNVPAAVAMLDRDMRYLQVSDRWCTDYLSGRAQIIGHSHYEIFPDMPERWKEVHRRALAGETLRADEDHWVGQDGSHWARWEVRPWKTPASTVGGILILAEDITRRKQAEEALAEMTRKLIEAQEQERARIGRELHDDINQRLAMLAVELEQPLDPSEFQNRVRGFREELRQISEDVQALSHDLHSSKLEYLGVVAGIKSWCKEFGERQKMKIDFRSDVRSVPPLDVGRPLFRVLQEALHNAAKHSGVKWIEVQLYEQSGEIHLTIRDLGKGFDIEAAKQGRGLGLTSMQERVRLVNGTITIESKPMDGTTIHVRVPFPPEHSSQRAAV